MPGAPRPPTANGIATRSEVARSPGPPRRAPSAGEIRPRSLQRLVGEAAGRITRFSAVEAFSALAGDAAIIDIRAQDARQLGGVIPGSLHIPRTVLEWRIAPESPWRNPHLGGLDQRLILVCDHGYSSILAASNLVELGFHRAGDVIGGFQAWSAGGLPVAPCRPRRCVDGALPGMGPPE